MSFFLRKSSKDILKDVYEEKEFYQIKDLKEKLQLDLKHNNEIYEKYVSPKPKKYKIIPPRLFLRKKASKPISDEDYFEN